MQPVPRSFQAHRPVLDQAWPAQPPGSPRYDPKQNFRLPLELEILTNRRCARKYLPRIVSVAPSIENELQNTRQNWTNVATKIPPKNRRWPAQFGVSVAETFPAAHVIACTEVSLKNLGLETIDEQQFHVWSDEWVNQGNWLEAVQKLKEEGKLRYFGVSINDFQPENEIGR